MPRRRLVVALLGDGEQVLGVKRRHVNAHDRSKVVSNRGTGILRLGEHLQVFRELLYSSEIGIVQAAETGQLAECR